MKRPAMKLHYFRYGGEWRATTWGRDVARVYPNGVGVSVTWPEGRVVYP